MSENPSRLIEQILDEQFCFECGLFRQPVVIKTMDYDKYEIVGYECLLCGGAA